MPAFEFVRPHAENGQRGRLEGGQGGISGFSLLVRQTFAAAGVHFREVFHARDEHAYPYPYKAFGVSVVVMSAIDRIFMLAGYRGGLPSTTQVSTREFLDAKSDESRDTGRQADSTPDPQVAAVEISNLQDWPDSLLRYPPNSHIHNLDLCDTLS